MARPPATYDVISRKQSNKFSPNLCQNVSKEYVHSYWKRQVYILIRLGKFKKNLMGVAYTPPPHLERPGVNSTLSVKTTKWVGCFLCFSRDDLIQLKKITFCVCVSWQV